jgi:hypothetical protein
MPISDYANGLKRSRYVVAVCTLIGLLAGWVYNYFTYLDEASAYVAVVSPLAARTASGATEAQVSFGSIIQSYTLASRVAARVGESPDTVYQNLSITTATSLTSSSTAAAAPLLVVSGKDHGMARAIRLTDIAVEEGRKLYISVNGADGADLKAGMAAESKAVQAQLATAQAVLDKFGADNNAVDLPDRINAQRSKVNSLALSVDGADGDQQGDANSPAPSTSTTTTQVTPGGTSTTNTTSTTTDNKNTDSTTTTSSATTTIPYSSSTSTSSGTSNATAIAYARDSARYTTLSSHLTAEQTELDRLTGLLPQYQALDFQVQAAQAQVTDFNAQQTSLLVTQLLPAEAQVKVLDASREQSQLLFLLLIYSLGLVSGVILGLSAVYLLVLSRPRLASAEDVVDLFSSPVLVRIPRGAR